LRIPLGCCEERRVIDAFAAHRGIDLSLRLTDIFDNVRFPDRRRKTISMT
jgi:hypothetical protein